MDSGIRLTVSALTTLTYNNGQAGTTSTGQYARHFTGSNLYPASDSVPMATNRIPQMTGLKYIYAGNLVANPAPIGSSMPVSKYVSMVDASLNNGNPCVDKLQAGRSISISDSTHQGAMLATASGEITTTAIFSSAIFAVCYSVGTGTMTDLMWRDSYIRLAVSKIQKVQSYGIEHITTGGIAAKPALRLLSVGTFLGTKYLSIIDESLNNYQPCVASHAGMAPTPANQARYSGVSISNTGNKHTLKTDLLSSALTFALCYTEGVGDTIDTGWLDSGIRLQTPKLTSVSYSYPPVTYTAESCFGNIDLYGIANCLGFATGTGSGVTGAKNSIRNSHLPQAPGVVISYGSSFSVASGGLGNNNYVSLVEHTLGRQVNNPCRDGSQVYSPYSPYSPEHLNPCGDVKLVAAPNSNPNLKPNSGRDGNMVAAPEHEHEG